MNAMRSVETPGGEPCWWDDGDLKDKNFRVVARLYNAHPETTITVRFYQMGHIDTGLIGFRSAQAMTLVLYDVYLGQMKEVQRTLEIAAQLNKGKFTTEDN